MADGHQVEVACLSLRTDTGCSCPGAHAGREAPTFLNYSGPSRDFLPYAAYLSRPGEWQGAEPAILRLDRKVSGETRDIWKRGIGSFKFNSAFDWQYLLSGSIGMECFHKSLLHS